MISYTTLVVVITAALPTNSLSVQLLSWDIKVAKLTINVLCTFLRSQNGYCLLSSLYFSGDFHIGSLVRKKAWFTWKIGNVIAVMWTGKHTTVSNPRLPAGGGPVWLHWNCAVIPATHTWVRTCSRSKVTCTYNLMCFSQHKYTMSDRGFRRRKKEVHYCA